MNLSLYDKNVNRIAIIGGQFVSCLWSEGYNTVENFSLELIETDEYKKKVSTGCYVGRSDRNTLMVITTVQIRNGKIVASGKQASRVLDDVCFVGTIESGSYIDTSLRNAYNNSNKKNKVVFAQSSLGIRYPGQISNKSFLDMCEIMCQSEDVGFRSIRKNNQVEIELYKPEDRGNLVFSEKFGNLTIDTISVSIENYKNYAIVLGAGEGEDRIRTYVDSTNGEERFEIIVDARDIQLEDGESIENYKSRLNARGVEKLLEKNKTYSCEFTPYSNDFGVKYDLGDVIILYLTDYGITLKSRVSKFTQKSKENKTTTNIVVGDITVKR